MKNDDAEMVVVILEDADFASLTDDYSKAVLTRWRSVRWDVCACHRITGRMYACEVDAETSVQARNAFVSKMTAERGLSNDWKLLKVRKV